MHKTALILEKKSELPQCGTNPGDKTRQNEA
ncbi:hypothetical protein ROS217_04545 [Roseovarius sp. 217]|nr:hypothetical protein ROS217_04545 [Roseovarius sp. 217]